MNSTKAPTAGAVPLRTETRTRSGFSVRRAPSIRWTRTTMRSERSRSSRTSTKPAISTFQAADCNTGCAMIARLTVAVANPAAAAASASAIGKATGRCRASTATAHGATASAERGPNRRLLIGREVEDDAETEGDCQPRHQPAGPDVGQRPALHALATARRSARLCGHASAGPRPARAPRPPRLGSPARSALRPPSRGPPGHPRHIDYDRMLHEPSSRVQRRLGSFPGHFRIAVAQADGAVEHEAAGRGILVAAKIALPLELDRRPPHSSRRAPARCGYRSGLRGIAD